MILQNPQEYVEWIEKLSELMRTKLSKQAMGTALDGNSTGTLDVETALICIDTSCDELKKMIDELQEYRSMYEGLCK